MPQKKKSNPDYGEVYGSDIVRTAIIDRQTFYAKAVQYSDVDGMAMFEGDIILGSVSQLEEETEMHRAEMRGEIARGIVIEGDRYRWPNCVVPYTIASDLPNQARVTDAIAHWEANTRYRFVERTAANENQYPDWINFRPSNGCSSYVGRQGGEQPINLAPGCSTGNTIHEIGHAIGLWHEQSREDRDSRVIIHWDKIQPGREHNFNQHISDGDDVGVYDYGSIMHYPRSAFSIDGSDTITPIDSNATIGQRNGLSPGDIAAANSLCPRIVCPPAPRIACPPAPRLRCPPAPRLRCPPAPRITCPPAPRLRCPPAPRITCPPAPRIVCPPAPRIACPPAPRIVCPPAPRIACPPAPRIACPPAPRITCPPAPAGCTAGPYMRPRPPFRPAPVRRFDYDPYGDAYDEAYEESYAYADPSYSYYAYDDTGTYGGQWSQQDWTAYEYADPYEGYEEECQYYDPEGYFYPQYEA